MNVRARLRPVIIAAAERGQALARRHNWLPEAPIPQPLGDGTPADATPVDGTAVLNEYGLAGIDAVLHTLRGVELSRMPVPAGIPGCPLFGPYMPFSPGHYRATFTLRRRGKAASRGRLAVLDIADGQGNVLVQHPLRAGDLRPGEWTQASIECDVTELTWGGQFRVNCTGQRPSM